MKNFKLFLLSGVFCILIVSVAIAETRDCADKMPTCAQLGYKWECDTSKSGRYLSCPWDLSKVYCATSLTELNNLTGAETVDCSRKNCAVLGFKNDVAECGKYNYLPCPFNQNRVFCTNPTALGVATDPGGVGGSGGNSAVAGPTLP